MRSKLYGVIGIVMGIGLLVVGVTSSGSDEVECGSRIMSPGDTCTTIQNGSSTERSYEEQKSQNGREAVIMMILGPLVAIGGVVMLVGSTVGRRRRVRHAPHPGPYPGPPGAYGAQPGHPAPPAYPPAPPAYPPAPPAYPPAPPAYPPAPPAAHPAYPAAPPPAQPPYPPPAQPYPPQPPGGHPPYRG